MRWHISFGVGRPGVHFLSVVIPKGKTFNGMPLIIMWKTGGNELGEEMGATKLSQAYCKDMEKEEELSLFSDLPNNSPVMGDLTSTKYASSKT